MKIAVIMPAHNEAQAIAGVVRQVRACGYDCVVINDGSTDATAVAAGEAGAFVLNTASKSGKGNALKMGFNHAIQKGYEVLIAMDSDGQHLPSDIAGLVKCFESSHADIVCGNRMNNTKGMPLVRLCTNRFMSWLISLFCHSHIPDTQCGFRLIKTQVLEAVKLESSDFEIETELLIKASKKGFKIASADIQTVYQDEVSKIRPVRDTIRFVAYLWREACRKNG